MADKQFNRYRFGSSPAVEQKRNRAKLTSVILFTVIFFTLLSGVFYGLSSPFFNLQEITYQGSTVLSQEELLQVFPYPWDTNIWKIDLGRVEKEYASLPRIHHARVERRLPGTLNVTLEEKHGAALIPYQGYYFEVAADGTILGTISSIPPGGFPMVTEVTELVLRPGENIGAAPGGELVVAFLASLGEEEGSISEIRAGNPNNLVIITVSGHTIWLGRGDYEAKILLLPEILAALTERKGYLDFRVLGAPAFVGS